MAIVVDARTEHKMKSPTGIIALVVGDSKLHADTDQCGLNPMHDLMFNVVVENSKSCVDTEHEVKSKVKQESL